MPIATPEVYAEMLDKAKQNRFAYPAINVSSSQTLNAAIRGFAEAYLPLLSYLEAPPTEVIAAMDLVVLDG